MPSLSLSFSSSLSSEGGDIGPVELALRNTLRLGGSLVPDPIYNTMRVRGCGVVYV